MATKVTMKKSAIRDVDFDFTDSFLSTDPISSVAVTISPGGGLADVSVMAVISGMIVKRFFNGSAGSVGTEYAVQVKATTAAGAKDVLDADITVVPD